MLPHDQKRLQKIKEYCEDIQAAVHQHGKALEIFQSDREYQYVISFCILQIGELASGLTEEFRSETKKHISWREIKAMRNIVAHDYGNVDLETVWEVVTADIPDLYHFCTEQLSK